MSLIPNDRCTNAAGCRGLHNVQLRYLNNNIPKQEAKTDSKDIKVETPLTTRDILIHGVMHRLWKHLTATSIADLPDKLDALSRLVDFWERKDSQQIAFDMKPVVQWKTEIKATVKKEALSETTSDAASEYSIDTKANRIPERSASRSKKLKFSHDHVESYTNFEKTNQPGVGMQTSTTEPIIASRLIKESIELMETAKEHSLLAEGRLRSSKTACGFLTRQQRLMPFSVKSESNQVKDMLRWLAVPYAILDQAINSTYKIRKEDFKCNTQNLRDSFMDSAVRIELLKPYLECSTLRLLQRVIDEKKDADVWSCGCCRERVISRAIFCDECLMWFHYKCVSISSTPDRNANWFCPACSSND